MINSHDRVISRERLADYGARWREEGKRIVFTNGVFDLLHVGHVQSLTSARNLGDILVVGVNSDNSTKQLKGDLRPLIPQTERAELLLALRCVDYVTIFEECSADETLLRLRPHLYVKGGDYCLSDQNDTKAEVKLLMEEATVKSYGGSVALIPYLPGHSTTELIEKILRVFRVRN